MEEVHEDLLPWLVVEERAWTEGLLSVRDEAAVVQHRAKCTLHLVPIWASSVQGPALEV